MHPKKLAKCARCKALYVRVRSKVCDRCQEDEEADYRRVREVLERIDHLNAEELAEEAEVSVACVLRLLDDGLLVHDSLNTPVACGRCGAQAISRTKRLCHRCLLELDAKFSEELRTTRQSVVPKKRSTANQVHQTLSLKRRG